MKKQELGITNQEEKTLEELLVFVTDKSDKRMVEKVSDLARSTTKALDKYLFNAATSDLYEFIWHTFADKYIEDVKSRADERSFIILYSLFIIQLKLLHPFMPFITEEIYQKLTKQKEFIMVANWPA